MKILALQRESHVANGVMSLSVSARITEVLEYMYSLGILDFIEISESDKSVYRALEWSDVLILNKHSSREAIEITRKAKSLKKLVIYDIDDWIFSFPSYSAGNGQNDKLENITELLNLSDHVTVANENLYEKVRSMANNVHILPNGMWVEKYQRNPEPPDPRPRIVFTNADLIKLEFSKDALFTALQVFFMKNNNYVLDFFGDPFPEMHSLPFLHFTNRMPYESYMNALASGRYQFSISPLGGDEDGDSKEFNKCKNPFKYLNYGAARVPGIYSSTDIYVDCIKNRENGIIVENNYEAWFEALTHMAENESLRKNIKDCAYNDVLENYHIKFSARVLEDLLNN